MLTTLKRGLVVVTVGYLLSRVVFYLLGIRFLGMENINVYLQFIDPPLLEHDLLRSLYYSSFPPLYNLIVGGVLKCFGESAPAFAVLHLFTGWGIGMVLFLLMVDLGVEAMPAVAATLLFLALPPMILYENWLFYSYFETLFFLLAVWSFHHFVQKPERIWGLLLFSSYTALALLNARMMFFILIILPLLWWGWRKKGPDARRVRLTAIAATPVLLVLLVMAKNAWLFGSLTVDPHFGFHMGNGFVYAAWGDAETHEVCLRDYPMLLTAPTDFPPAAKVGLEPPASTGIALWDEPLRSKGKQNYNSLYYLQISKMYSEELGDFIRSHPRLYEKFIAWAFLNYWKPSSHYVFFPKTNLQILGAYDTFYSRAYPVLWFLYPAAIFFGLAAGWRDRWRQGPSLTLLFAMAVIAYNMLAIFVTLGENDRYKFTIEPLLWLLVIMAIQRGMDAFRSRQHRA